MQHRTVFIGYKKTVIRYTGNNQADFAKIMLKSEAQNIKDVVVTGVYRRKKESFTGSSATFKGDELKSVGAQNVLQSLKTLDPSFKSWIMPSPVPTLTRCQMWKSVVSRV